MGAASGAATATARAVRRPGGAGLGAEVRGVVLVTEGLEAHDTRGHPFKSAGHWAPQAAATTPRE